MSWEVRVRTEPRLGLCRLFWRARRLSGVDWSITSVVCLWTSSWDGLWSALLQRDAAFSAPLCHRRRKKKHPLEDPLYFLTFSGSPWSEVHPPPPCCSPWPVAISPRAALSGCSKPIPTSSSRRGRRCWAKENKQEAKTWVFFTCLSLNTSLLQTFKPSKNFPPF